MEKSDIKMKTDGQQPPKVDEFESCEKVAPEDKADEEDVCPICLEGCFLWSSEQQLFYVDMPGLELKYRMAE